MAFKHCQRISQLLSLLLMVSLTSLVPAQTKITPPKNKYKIQDDIQIGRQGVQEVKKQMPVFPQGDETDRYVEMIGQRLVQAIPQEFFVREFEYSFDVVNARDINAFALPGGPMFVNRGMIEAARTEGEMAGVMAHEISHVVLRHGTAQQTKATSGKVLAGVLAGVIGGAIIGGTAGEAIAQGTQMAAAGYILKYSREYETQSDILGAQIMARAGYDPRDLANMFKTIEQQSGGQQGPEWLSSHPNPGNRYERINQEAQLLRVNRGRFDDSQFQQAKNRLRGLPQAPTMAEIAKQQQGQGTGQGNTPRTTDRIESRVEAPSGRYRDYNGGNLFSVQVPDNWRDYAAQSSVTLAPRGGHGDYNGQEVTTHGMLIGATQAQGRDLREASDNYINALLQGNNYLRTQGGYSRGFLDRRNALSRRLSGRSPITGRTENVTIYTTALQNGALFYAISVVPDTDARTFASAFDNMLRSLRIAQ
jgi:hypothetical protein